MYKFDKPIRKVGHYLIPVRNCVINIRCAKISMIQPLPRNKGTLMAFYLHRNTSSYDAIMDLDEAALNAVVSNNREWFKNDLSEEDIRGFWRPSISGQNTLIVETFGKEAGIETGAEVAVELQVMGIIIRQQGFKILWRIKTLTKIEIDDESVDDIDVEREPIERHWTREVGRVCCEADAKIADFEKKIAYLREFKADIRRLLDEAIAEGGVTPIWNQRLADIEMRIQAGR